MTVKDHLHIAYSLLWLWQHVVYVRFYVVRALRASPGLAVPVYWPRTPCQQPLGSILPCPSSPQASPGWPWALLSRGYLQADSLAKPQAGPTGDALCPGLGCPSAPPSALLPAGVVRQAWLWGPALLLLGEPPLLPTSQPQGAATPCCTMIWTMRKDLSKKNHKRNATNTPGNIPNFSVSTELQPELWVQITASFHLAPQELKHARGEHLVKSKSHLDTSNQASLLQAIVAHKCGPPDLNPPQEINWVTNTALLAAQVFIVLNTRKANQCKASIFTVPEITGQCFT